ncbi:hypothetical protein [Leucobacter sp. M11]|uniref:hypothetical protein n=1 Tax=Leucobacter sp. M11 TaxID=2993565 RepID=UPI002D7EA626|nr:hypothetical protein [Leucobacter sp. M11]MEB4613270.1 hypothetical protein [Leucobacter sp. M11]
MVSIVRKGEAREGRTQGLHRALLLVNVVAVVSAGAAVVWFGVAASNESGAQMVAASAMFAAVASG